ncbi:MAG TPA: hypothetical protein VIM70_09830 [Clostridium sp.]|uniref:hypothetical protein n=1 Tax=Clostridium sp. TaxID=1506 RepID=UPI002F954A10
MVNKVTISFPPHVYSLAKKKSKLTHGDNFSAYINYLVYSQFTEEELKNEINENKKPLWTGRTKLAEINSICKYCNEPIILGETVIYLSDLDSVNDFSKWVHKDCCRKD